MKKLYFALKASIWIFCTIIFLSINVKSNAKDTKHLANRRQIIINTKHTHKTNVNCNCQKSDLK